VGRLIRWPGATRPRNRLHDGDTGGRTQETALSVTDLVTSTVGVVVVEAITPALLNIAAAVGGEVVASTTLGHRSLGVTSTVLGEGALSYIRCQSNEKISGTVEHLPQQP
jgi:hypothetical protein